MADDEVTPLTTTTVNYGFVKPDVGASDDVWGGLLNTDLDNIDTTIKSVSNAIPAASSTTPVMNGSAAVGTETTWARADHVHPTDTSRAPLASPAFTGTPSMPTGTTGVTQTAGDSSTKLATTAFVSALPVAMGDNLIINGNFAVNQRGQVSGTALATTIYGHDRWKAGASGCTYTFPATLPDTTVTITAGTLTQIIEAGIIAGGVYTLSWTGTAQARVYQGSPTGSYAASPVVTASLTAGTNIVVEFNTGTVVRVKFENGSVATPFNRQSLARSMADCERYFRWVPFDIHYTAAVTGAFFGHAVAWPTMRAAPTLSAIAVDPNATPVQANVGTAQGGTPTPYGALLYMTSGGAGDTYVQGYRLSATAEL